MQALDPKGRGDRAERRPETVEQLGRYVLDRKLAQGGMAEVFLARQVGPGGYEKPCVVKRMLPALSEDITFVEMFLDEARVAARLAHPGIAQIFDFGHERDTYYLAMEYVPGANLKAVLESRFRARRFVPLPVAARLCSLVAQALDCAHHATDDKGRPLHIIHRDVSPQNVMVSVTGDVKLIDFGIAKAATDSHRTAIGTLKGKYAYMSPEQLRQQRVDKRTDIYALGLVFYELLTNRPAVPPSDNLNALMMAAAQRKYAPIESVRPEVPKKLKAVLDRALALEPADRFQTARELSDQLEEWLLSSSVRVKNEDVAELVNDPALVSTEPGAPSAPRPQALGEGDVPPTVVPRTIPTVPDVPRPTARPAPVEVTRVDPSAAETPIVGTPPVGRRNVDVTDVSVPTEPERSGPEVEKIMAKARAALTPTSTATPSTAITDRSAPRRRWTLLWVLLGLAVLTAAVTVAWLVARF